MVDIIKIHLTIDHHGETERDNEKWYEMMRNEERFAFDILLLVGGRHFRKKAEIGKEKEKEKKRQKKMIIEKNKEKKTKSK